MQSIAEVWKDIQGYEGLYQVSNLGRVKSLRRSKIRKLYKDDKGYFRVTLKKKGKSKNFQIHRLVATAFIPNPENKPEVDHINTIRTDNRVQNLRWVTSSENSNNPLTKKHFIGKNHPMFGKKHSKESKLKMSINHNRFYGALNPNSKRVRNLDTFEIFDSIIEASKKYNVTQTAIIYAIKHGTKSVGFYWEYV